jgi:hypothetical protein
MVSPDVRTVQTMRKRENRTVPPALLFLGDRIVQIRLAIRSFGAEKLWQKAVPVLFPQSDVEVESD